MSPAYSPIELMYVICVAPSVARQPFSGCLLAGPLFQLAGSCLQGARHRLELALGGVLPWGACVKGACPTPLGGYNGRGTGVRDA